VGVIRARILNIAEEFNEIKISSLLLKGRSLPSLRAMKEDKVVPENVADFVTRPYDPYAQVQVQSTDLSYFASQ